MWKDLVSVMIAGPWLLGGGAVSSALEKGASDGATYWQQHRCLENDLGEGAVLRWCVESAVVTGETTLELHVSWTSAGVPGKVLFKGSDSNNHGMYVLDDLGNRYDHVATGGAARDGGRLDAEHRVLRGVFVFPFPNEEAKSFTFRDDDQKASIADIVLSRENRTDPASSAALRERLMRSQSLRIDAGQSGSGDEAHEQYLLRRIGQGFRLEKDSETAHPELVIPPPVMEHFFQSLSDSPLLARSYPPVSSVVNDYPAITLYMRTDKEEVIFFSRPEGARDTPWRVESKGKVYFVPDDTPLRSLAILDPFLDRDPESRAMKLLEPRVGKERASELWGELERPLGPEEALRVVRRLESLFSRNVEPSEIARAVGDYLARASSPVALPVETEVEGKGKGKGEGKGAPAPETGLDGSDVLAVARRGDADAVRTLVSSGADPDARGKDGRTALMLAAESGQVETVQALVDSRAKLDEQTLRGDTALAFAARSDHREAVRILLRAGASPRVKDSHGSTPLMETTDAYIARALIRGGADVNAVDDKGLTPMMRLIAAKTTAPSLEARAEMLQSLLTAGAEVHARDGEGRTALIWAVKGTPASPSYPDLVAMLLEAGSDLEARDREGGTALVYAAVRGDSESARLLLDAGADVNAHLGNLSALDIALRYGHSEIVALLIRVGARR
jgi:ankyrin repeat protein